MFFKSIRGASLTLALVAPVLASAAAPSWVADAMTSAKTDLLDYLTAAAPLALSVVIAVAAFYFIVRLVRKIAH